MTANPQDSAAAREIFLSYAHEDRESARMVAEALRRSGIAVWWDRKIVPGQKWQNEIDEAIRGARCVVLLWSRHAAASDYVKAESTLAFQKDKLVPVLLENVELPVPYNSIQALDLSQWSGDDEAAEFRGLLEGIRAKTGKADVPGGGGSPPPNSAGRRAWRATLISWAWIGLPSIVAGGLALALMSWRVPTELDIEVTATKVRLHAVPGSQQVLLESAIANSIVLSGFQEVTVPVSEAAAANPLKWDAQEDVYPETAWVSMQSSPSLVLHTAGRSTAQVTLRPVAQSSGPLVLSRIFAGAASVTLASPQKGTLNVELRGPRFSGTVTLPESVRLDLENCVRAGPALPFPGPSATLRVRVPRQSRLLEYSSGESGMTIILEVPESRQEDAFPASSFEIDRVEFLDQGPGLEPSSTLSGDGSIRYTQYQGISPVPLKAAEFLTIEDLRSFYLRKISWTGQQKGLRMQLQGVAGKAVSGPKGRLRDRRLTRFDILWNNQKVVALFTVLVWAVPTFLLLRRYLKDYAGRRPRSER